MFLRLASLALKLLLTLYMGKYLGLTEMGTYGLITAYVSVLIPILGFRLDYVVTRDIVDIPQTEMVTKVRDQSIFYSFNYLGLIGVAGAFLLLMPELDSRIVIFTLILSITESFAAVTSGHFIPLGRPIISNLLFFIRSALWVVPVIALGVFYPEYRDADTVFMFWLGGILISLLITVMLWSRWPWHGMSKVPVNWAWIKTGIIRCFPIWLGAIATAAAASMDRFVVEHYLGRDFVGIVSFYGSFTLAIMALMTSGIFAFTYPKLIKLHNQKDEAGFYRLVWKMTYETMLAAGGIALVLGYVIPEIGLLLDQPGFYEQALTFWLLLFAMWLKAVSESLYYVLYTWAQDRSIWVGSFLSLVVSLVTNLVFVQQFGFIGIGYSAIVTAIAAGVWRLYQVKKYKFQYEEK